jgi:hypothetical protein
MASLALDLDLTPLDTAAGACENVCENGHAIAAAAEEPAGQPGGLLVEAQKFADEVNGTSDAHDEGERKKLMLDQQQHLNQQIQLQLQQLHELQKQAAAASCAKTEEVAGKIESHNTSKKRKKPSNGGPRKRTGYIIYCDEKRTQYGGTVPFNAQSKTWGQLWNAESDQVRERYNQRALEEKEQMLAAQAKKEVDENNGVVADGEAAASNGAENGHKTSTTPTAPKKKSKKPKSSGAPRAQPATASVVEDEISMPRPAPSAYDCFKKRILSEITDNHPDEDEKHIHYRIAKNWNELNGQERLQYEKEADTLQKLYLLELERSTESCNKTGP